ncbi:MAG: phosphoenolpyruvate--protein phosphotransferase [Clostridia bacterium]|nr:phosphoenolpyruvate--protein phosphotransferase [Clostridia bacterium]
MIEINGKTVYNSLAMGKLQFLTKNKKIIKRLKTDSPREEIIKLEAARKTAKVQLRELYQKALVSVGETNAQVFEIHIMMLEDEDYFGAITSMIQTQHVNAEYAVSYTSDIFAKTFSDMDDEYMKARAADVHDIAERLISILSNKGDSTADISEPAIIVAEDLTPSETVRLDKDMILGFVTFKGSSTSHTAILARTMNIPAIINTGEISADFDGRTAILDGSSGTLYIDPDDDKIIDFKHRKSLEEKPNETKSGKKINLFANIGHPRDVPSVIANDAGGIGLFRSEFLYLEKNSFPTEDEQFLKYKEVAEKMGSKKVIVRTLDIGADKKIDYFNLPNEENPALGFRAIRICLSNTKIFKTQLRAILRASAFGNISIMFPMIISQSEVRKAKSLLDECKCELKSEGIPFNSDIEIGIMIETPASAIISDLLAPEVDFFSIGTNDLIQYTLAADRQNHSLEQFIDTHHPAILRLIEIVTQNAHKHGKWVGICGELASDPELCETFVNLGIDELSVSPSQVFKVREIIRNID